MWSVGFEAFRLSRRLTAVIALGGLLCVAMLIDRVGLPAISSSPAVRSAATSAAPSAEYLAASRGLGRDERQYWVSHRAGGDLSAQVNAGQLHASFSRRGVLVSGSTGTAGFALARLTRGARVALSDTVAPSANANRVSYRRAGDVTEWYANGPLGLEQGLTLARRPLGAGGDWLTLDYALSGSLRAALRDGTVAFLDSHGKPALRWLGLYATDERGRSLPTGIALSGSRLAIRVRDQGARYPLTIDPLIQVATLTASDAVQADDFGFSVAESGSLLAVGAPGSFTSGGPSGNGAVYVFVKPASGWANAQQTAKLTASDGAAFDQLGYSVAISGTTILAGAPNKNSNTGAVYIFNQPPSGTWVSGHQSGELTATGETADGSLGTSLVADGTTVLAGAPFGFASPPSPTPPGTVYVFNKPTSGWATATQSGTLTSSDPGALDFGWSLGLDGTTLAVGAPGSTIGSNSAQGAVYEFTEPAMGWVKATQTARLLASDGVANDFFGRHLAVGGNGSTIAVGDALVNQGSNTSQGEAYVFTQTGGVWSSGTQAARLLASDGGKNSEFGYSIAVSTDGSIVYVGAANGHGLYRFVQPSGGWSDLSQAAESGYQTASAFSLSVTGTDILEGAYNDSGAGQVNVFGDQSSPPAAVAPTNVSLPFAFGTTTVGATVSAFTGMWSGTTPIGYSHQWQRCNPGCVDIPGATGSSYTLVPADVGAKVLDVVTASNSAGSAHAASNTLGPVAPNRSQILAALSQVLVPHGKNAKIGALLKHGGYKFTFTAPSAGRLVINWFFLPPGAHISRKAKPVKIATASITFSNPGTFKVKVHLTGHGKQLLRGAKATLKVTAKDTFTPEVGNSASLKRRFKLRR